jgi:hypothetical protein
MSDIDHARVLLEMASYDLRALQHMLDPDAFAEGIFGFHAQQAIEKSFIDRFLVMWYVKERL